VLAHRKYVIEKIVLRYWELERNWTQAGTLQLELDVSRQTIIAIEKGKYDPSLSLRIKAARLFNMQIETISKRDEDS